ncbi:MAG TPA: PEGA domain-containing protein, partial [Candidatus Marinimicrobia bacterium]|nr:PEGA domain-containing protein [Candidatus Neomarinimicrobiota bacterium]
TAALQTKPGSINIKSKPAKARVYLDGKEVGTTPYSSESVGLGTHEVEVRMDGYENWNKIVEVEADKENVLTVALQMMGGTISIESAPTNAKIFLDGKKINKTPKIIKNILPGKHLLEARMDGYEDWGEVVDVEAYNDYALKAVLLAKPGSINVKSKPANATIYLDGEEIGITPATITDLMPGEYMLELKMDGYEVWSESINVETNIEKTLTATLQLKTGSIMIDSEPANATIYLDGERIGTTPE